MYYLYQIFAREQILRPYSISDWPYAGACSAVSSMITAMLLLIYDHKGITSTLKCEETQKRTLC